MSDWLDIDDQPPALPVAVQQVTDLREQLLVFDAAWTRLTDKQQKFLHTLSEYKFNERRTARHLGFSDGQPDRRWLANADYALCRDIIRKTATSEVLSKERLVLRHDEMVESLMTPKPVLHQGIPVIVDGQILHEIDAGAAAKVNKDLMEIGGHAKPQEGPSFGNGPPLIIQVTNRVGGEVISQVTVGAVPAQALPSAEDDEWPSTP